MDLLTNEETMTLSVHLHMHHGKCWMLKAIKGMQFTMHQEGLMLL